MSSWLSFIETCKKKFTLFSPKFVIERREHVIRCLHKAFYNLCQVLKARYTKIDAFLREEDFTKVIGDYNLYINKLEDNILLLVVYMDNILFYKNYI